MGRLNKYISVDDTEASTDEINEKFIGFGPDGTAEIHGKDITLSKKGQSIEITKEELIALLQKMGMVKKKTR